MKRLHKSVKDNFVAVLVPLLFYIVILIISPTSRNLNGAISLLKQGFAPAVLAWGVLFSMSVGNWDFSVGANVLLASIIGGNLAQDLHLGIVGMFFICVIIGSLCAASTSLVYSILNIPSLIASLGMLLIYESISGWIYGGEGLVLDTSYVIFGQFPINIISFILAFAVAYILYYRCAFGYRLRAVGSNSKVAESNGINIVKYKMLAMICVGLFSGIYSVINIGSAGVARTASNMQSMAVCFESMMCVFIGLSITRKGNRIFGVYCGSLVMQMVNMILMILNVNASFRKIVIAVIVIVLMVSANRPDISAAIRHKLGFGKAKAVKGVG